MVESWQLKRYYPPRVLISAENVTDEAVAEVLLCLSNTEVSVLLGLLEYAHRRSTWVVEHRDTVYVSPDADLWDLVQAWVATLEGKLMAGMCDQVTELLTEIRDAIELCCGSGGVNVPGSIIPDNWQTVPGITRYFGYGTELPNEILLVTQDDERCALAQLWYQGLWEMMTEAVLPSLRTAWSSLLPAAAFALATWTGGITFPVVLGVWAFASLLSQLLDVAYDVAESNIQNYMMGARHDITCAMYFAFAEGSQLGDVAEAAYQRAFADAPDLSYGDKLILRLFGWVTLLGVKRAREEATPWAEFYVVPGYCADCEEEPEPDIEGDDWWAQAIPDGEGRAILTKSGEASWVGGCVPLTVTHSYPLVGVVWDVTTLVGGCILKAMTAETTGCQEGESCWPDSSGDRTQGRHFNLVQDRINQAQAYTMLAPGSAVRYEFTEWDGPGTVTPAFQMGWQCTGQRQVDVRYLVFAKTPA